jgi:hypothetical protein
MSSHKVTISRYECAQLLGISVRFWLMAFSSRPAYFHFSGVDGVSRFSRVEFPCMPGFSDCAESCECSRFRIRRCCLVLIKFSNSPQPSRAALV